MASTEGLDGLLIAAGAPWVVRALLKKLFQHATMTIVQDGKTLAVEDRSNPGPKGKPEMYRFVEGVDSTRKDRYGFKLTERCRWERDEDLDRYVWTLETHGYFKGRFGPVVSRYYLLPDPTHGHTLVSEVRFRGATMTRRWKPCEETLDEKKPKRWSKRFGIKRTASSRASREGNAAASTSATLPSQAAGEAAGPKPDSPGNPAALRVLVCGLSGNPWVAGQLATRLASEGAVLELSKAPPEDAAALRREVARLKPTHAVLFLPSPHREDGCAQSPPPAALPPLLRSTLTAALHVADACLCHGVHLTLVTQQQQQPGLVPQTGGGEDVAAWAAQEAEAVLARLGRAGLRLLVLRLGHPVGTDVKHPANVLSRLASPHLQEGPPLRISVLPELLPNAIGMMAAGREGEVDMTNPGIVTADRLAALMARPPAAAEGGTDFPGGPLPAEESLARFVLRPLEPDRGEVDTRVMCGFIDMPFACLDVRELRSVAAGMGQP